MQIFDVYNPGMPAALTFTRALLSRGWERNLCRHDECPLRVSRSLVLVRDIKSMGRPFFPRLPGNETTRAY